MICPLFVSFGSLSGIQLTPLFPLLLIAGFCVYLILCPQVACSRKMRRYDVAQDSDTARRMYRRSRISGVIGLIVIAVVLTAFLLRRIF